MHSRHTLTGGAGPARWRRRDGKRRRQRDKVVAGERRRRREGHGQRQHWREAERRGHGRLQRRRDGQDVLAGRRALLQLAPAALRARTCQASLLVSGS